MSAPPFQPHPTCLAFVLALCVATLLLSGCAAEAKRSPAENLYVIDHDGETPSEEQVRPYDAALARVARSCPASKEKVSDYTVSTVDLIKKRSGKDYTLLEVLQGFPIVPNSRFKCVEKFAVYGLALEGG